MKSYGSAVYMALLAQYLPLRAMKQLIPHERFKAIAKGADGDEWLCCFWEQLALIGQ